MKTSHYIRQAQTQYKKGFISPLLLGLVALLLVGGGTYTYVHTKKQGNQATTDVGADTKMTSDGTIKTFAITAFTWLPTSALPSAYEINGPTWYWIVNGGAHCMNSLVPNSDVTTFFAASTGEYAKDSQHVYRCSEIVKDADPSSFTILNKNFAKDKSHVYYAGDIVIGADSASFEAIPSPASSPDASRPPYGKDKNHVYYLSKEMENANPQTFTLSPVIRDKNWIYRNDKVFGPVSLISETYAHALPPNCTKEGQWTPKPSLVPSIFSKDETVVGYVGPNAVCIIDRKSQKSEYYEKGWENVVALSEDGSKLLYSNCPSKGPGGSPSDCGTYSINRATGKEERVK